MRRILALAGMMLWVCSMAPAQNEALSVGRPAPDFVLADLSGKFHQLSRGYGRQVAIVAVGRVESATLRTAMKELQKLQQRYSGDRVAIYLISLDPPEAEASTAATLKQFGVTYRVLTGVDFGIPRDYQVSTMSHLLVVDAGGVIRFSQSGDAADVFTKLAAVAQQYRPPKLPRLVDIEGIGCASCKAMPAILRELQQQLAGKIIIEMPRFNPDIADEYGVEVTPTQIFFNADGKEVYRHVGLMTTNEILDQLKKMGVGVE
ncbi:MAG: redoxin domain-containing protein [Armatimonadota bacterium]